MCGVSGDEGRPHSTPCIVLPSHTHLVQQRGGELVRPVEEGRALGSGASTGPGGEHSCPHLGGQQGVCIQAGGMHSHWRSRRI